MTALGLAVAIPAVLAYNYFNRSNRVLMNELDGFAHDLFAFMSTGVQHNTKNTGHVAPMHSIPKAQEA
jgi:biopolymer transport protein ExbB